jgi:hypothetical protein
MVACGDYGTPFVTAHAVSAAVEAFLAIVRALEQNSAMPAKIEAGALETR